MTRAIILSLAAALPGCMMPSLSKLENSIVYQPMNTAAGFFHPPISVSPMAEDRFEEVNIPLLSTKSDRDLDQHNLKGWFAEAKQPRAIVLYCHGNAGSLRNCAEVLRTLRDKLNVTILAFDYRGYGESAKLPISETALYQDAYAARRWLANRTGIDEKDIILYGYSLGGAVAVELASKDGARGLILDRTFTSIPDVADSHVPLLPVGWLLESKYDSLSKIKNYHGPLLQLHGDKDRVVPYKLGEKLFANANMPKQFVHMCGCGHNDSLTLSAIDALDKFFFDMKHMVGLFCVGMTGPIEKGNPGYFAQPCSPSTSVNR